MAIASLVLGIIVILFSWFPMCGLFFALPAVVGLILGIVGIVMSKKTGEHKGMAIAGTVLNGLSLIVMIGVTVSMMIFSQYAEDAASDYANDIVNEITDSLEAMQDSIAKEIEQELADTGFIE